MTQPTYTVPSPNSPTSTEEPKIIAALAELKSILTDGIQDDNIAPSAIGDGSLASPNNARFSVFDSGSIVLNAASAAGTYMVPEGGVLSSEPGWDTGEASKFFYLRTPDFTVAGRNLRWKLRMQVLTNDVSPAAVLTMGLYPITSIVASVPQFGSQVADSDVAIDPDGVNTRHQAVSDLFSLSDETYYCIRLNIEQETAVGSVPLIGYQLLHNNPAP